MESTWEDCRMDRPKIYCAGPLFNEAERVEMTAIADALVEAGYRVYLPHRDGMEFRLIHELLIDRGHDPAIAGQFLHEAIFALDIYQLVKSCDAVVWNLNGRVPDEGAVSESAMAWILGKPLVAFSNDVRSLIAGRVNPLLVGLVDFSVVRSIEEIVPALREELERTSLVRVDLECLPPRVRRAVESGGILQMTINSSSDIVENHQIADCVERLFSPGVRT